MVGLGKGGRRIGFGAIRVNVGADIRVDIRVKGRVNSGQVMPGQVKARKSQWILMELARCFMGSIMDTQERLSTTPFYRDRIV